MLPGIDVCLAWAQHCASSPKLSFNPHFTDVETEPRGAWVTCWRSCNSCQLVSAFRSVCLQSPRARNCSSVGQEFIFPVTGTALGSKPSFCTPSTGRNLFISISLHTCLLYGRCVTNVTQIKAPGLLYKQAERCHSDAPGHSLSRHGSPGPSGPYFLFFSCFCALSYCLEFWTQVHLRIIL